MTRFALYPRLAVTITALLMTGTAYAAPEQVGVNAAVKGTVTIQTGA